MELNNFYTVYRYLYFCFSDLTFMRKVGKVYQNRQDNFEKE